jgi:hypothetical protein
VVVNDSLHVRPYVTHTYGADGPAAAAAAAGPAPGSPYAAVPAPGAAPTMNINAVLGAAGYGAPPGASAAYPLPAGLSVRGAGPWAGWRVVLIGEGTHRWRSRAR